MKPKFDNKGLNVLYYTLLYGTAIATGIVFVLYERGSISFAAMIAVCALFVMVIGFDYTRNFIFKKETPSVIEEKDAEDGAPGTKFDIYDAKAAVTPRRVLLGVSTVLILLIAWVWAWSQHEFDGVFFMDRPFSIYIGTTLIALGMLLVARYPFLLDEGRYRNMAQVKLGIDRKQINALLLALGLMAYAFLKNLSAATPWHTISLLVLGFVWLDFFLYYHERIKDAGNAVSSDADPSLAVQSFKVRRTVLRTVIEAVIFILLTVAWYIKLSADGQNLATIFQSPLTTLAFMLLSIAFLVAAYHPAWFFSKVKESLKTKHIVSFVHTQQSWAVVFALLAVLSSLYDYRHLDLTSNIVSIGMVILFIAVGYFFGGLDKRENQKNK